MTVRCRPWAVSLCPWSDRCVYRAGSKSTRSSAAVDGGSCDLFGCAKQRLECLLLDAHPLSPLRILGRDYLLFVVLVLPRLLRSWMPLLAAVVFDRGGV